MVAEKPVVAVIPHYNMPRTLKKLLTQAVEQRYAAVYVLDDHSTNCDIAEIVAPFGAAVHLVVGTENRGAGGNRNRILEVNTKKLDGAILHFIDADCELVNSGTPESARKLFRGKQNFWAGGLVYTADDDWMKYNFFPGLTWQGLMGSALQELITLTGSRTLNRGLRRLSEGLREFPDVFASPASRQVFAVSEANILIPYNIFADIGGYDANFRDREVIDLAMRLKAKGAVCRFEPVVAVKHHAVQVRGWTRPFQSIRASWQIVRKYGLPLR